MHIVLILCKNDALSALIDELQDWQGEGAQVVSHGTTPKASQGYITVSWDKPIPALFHQKMLKDADIIDYIMLSNGVPQTPPA